jgi:hypothetical protein
MIMNSIPSNFSSTIHWKTKSIKWGTRAWLKSETISSFYIGTPLAQKRTFKSILFRIFLETL